MAHERNHTLRLNRLRNLGLVFAGSMLILGVACNSDDEASTPTATPTASETPASTETPPSSGGGAAGGIEPANPDAPPQGTVASASGEVDLGLGSYCWSPPASSGNPALCADAIGIITATADLVVEPGEVLTIADDEPGTLPWPPMAIDTATLYTLDGEPVAQEADFRAWQPGEGGTNLDTDSSEIGAHTITVPADLEPGRYLLAVFYTAGPDRGSDATYGAVLVVE